MMSAFSVLVTKVRLVSYSIPVVMSVEFRESRTHSISLAGKNRSCFDHSATLRTG
jgi:hypothetical protein